MFFKKLHMAMLDLAAERTKEELGDRSKYLGASEIGKCHRQVILNKMFKIQHSLKTLFIFERGHMTEDVIYKALVQSGIKPIRQYECTYENISGMKVIAHIDFTIMINNSIYIIECKSVGSIGVPDNPYPEHEEQLSIQMNLALLKNPGKIIKGGILYVSMDGDMKLFSEGYSPSNSLFKYQMEKALDIWETYQMALGVTDIRGFSQTIETTPGPLCAFCPHSGTCPRMKAKMFEEMTQFVAETYKIQQEIKVREKALKARKTQLKDFLNGMEFFQFETKTHNVRMVKQTRHKIDYKSLEPDMEEHGLELDNYRTPYDVSFPEIKPLTDWLEKAA